MACHSLHVAPIIYCVFKSLCISVGVEGGDGGLYKWIKMYILLAGCWPKLNSISNLDWTTK